MTDAASAAPSLLPCPFCHGVDVELSATRKYGHGESSDFGHVQCSGCGASFTVGGDYAGVHTERELKEMAAARWNHRAQPTPPAVVEPLEPVVTDVHGINERIHFRRGWRAAEAAHGIGIKKENGNADQA